MKIGLLLPRSVLYPSMGFDLNDGLKLGLKNAGLDNACQVVSTSIGVASKNEDVYAKCEQMLLDGVDIIIGYMNPATAEFIHPLFESAGRTLLVLDSGYHFPLFDIKLPRAYFLSLQGNLCCRSVTRKAVKDGHSQFAFACSFYDAGYRPPYTYATSMERHGNAIRFNHVTALKKVEFNLDKLTDFLAENEGTALLASFCGDMAEDFFRESERLSLLNKHSVYGAGFTAEEIWLDKIPYPGKNWDCAIPWASILDTPDNKVFVETMEALRSGKANLFSLMGWEASQFIAAMMEGKTPDQVEAIDSPRGRLTMDPETHYSLGPVYYATVVRNEANGNCRLDNIRPATDIEGDRKSLEEDMEAIRHQPSNSWFNAYACLES